MKLNDHVSETLLNIKMDKVTSKVSENKLVKGSLSLTGESKLFVKLKHKILGVRYMVRTALLWANKICLYIIY